MVALFGVLCLGLVGSVTMAGAQEATPNPSPTTEATRSPKDWSSGSVIGTKLDSSGNFNGNDGRMISPQNQTQTPFSPTRVIVKVGDTLPCSVETATDMDHWRQPDNDGDSSNDNNYGEDYGDSGDGVNYTWNCTGGGFPTETVFPGASATWTAPMTPGRYILSCVIDDTPTPVDSPETGSREDASVIRSVEVYVVKLVIKWEGVDVTDKTQNTIVGRIIRPVAEVQGAEGLNVGSPIWSVAGYAIQDWTHGQNESSINPLSEWDLYGSSIYFAWVDSGSKIVSYKVFIDNREFSAQTNFNVDRPDVSVTASPNGAGVIAIDSNTSKGTLDFTMETPS